MTRRLDDLKALIEQHAIENHDDILLTVEQARLESQKKRPDRKSITAKLTEVLDVAKAIPVVAEAIREIASVAKLVL